jgi:hypothetical protein
LEQVSSILFSLYRGTPDYGEWIIRCLKGVWPKLLGNRLAKVCRPARFDGSTLEIEILENDWKAAIKSVEAELLEKLRAATAGEVKKIKFSVVGSQPGLGKSGLNDL